MFIRIILAIIICLGLALAQEPELKIIKAPPISMEMINQKAPDRERQALETKSDSAINNIRNTVQDSAKGTADFVLRIGGKRLTAVTLYEVKVLKSIARFHKILVMEKKRGLITQEQYNMACQSLIQTFRSAMIQRPLFEEQS